MAADEDKLEAVFEQLRFRTANERLRRIFASHRFEEVDRAPFICECADGGCFEVVMLSLEEYDHVRTDPSWLVLIAGHEDDEAEDERVLELERGHVIIEKIGPAVAAAARLR